MSLLNRWIDGSNPMCISMLCLWARLLICIDSVELPKKWVPDGNTLVMGVCSLLRALRLQTRFRWWQWWGTPEIIWNRVPDRRSKTKQAITKSCLTVCRSIEKRHGVWAGASVAGVWLSSTKHISDKWWCSTVMTVVAQTSYFVGTS